LRINKISPTIYQPLYSLTTWAASKCSVIAIIKRFL